MVNLKVWIKYSPYLNSNYSPPSCLHLHTFLHHSYNGRNWTYALLVIINTSITVHRLYFCATDTNMLVTLINCCSFSCPQHLKSLECDFSSNKEFDIASQLCGRYLTFGQQKKLNINKCTKHTRDQFLAGRQAGSDAYLLNKNLLPIQ